MYKSEPYGKKSGLQLALDRIKRACKRRKGYKCSNMTKALEKELKKEGLLS